MAFQLRYPLGFSFSSNTGRQYGLQPPSRCNPGICAWSSARRNFLGCSGIRAAAGQLGSGSNQVMADERPLYHPFEEIAEVAIQGRDARLTSAETSRTVIEVNSKGTLMFSGFVDDEILDNLFWPDLPYVSDEHGNIYFMVNGDEDVLQGLASDDNMVQVVIGLHTTELLNEMDYSGLSDFDFGFEELADEASEINDSDDGNSNTETDEEDWDIVLDDCDAVTFWNGLESMEYVHPMRFAEKIAEVTSDCKVDWMQQPPAGISVRGILRPVHVHGVNQPVIHMKTLDKCSANTDKNISASAPVSVSGDVHQSHLSPGDLISEDAIENKDRTGSGISFYKLEMINMKLVSSRGHQATVEIEDFRNVCPDAIAHSATKIMSRLKESGDKTTKALKGLCSRLKGIQVEEAMVTGIDSLGFDLRVRCETQFQTLRFGFNTRATSEFSAERQLNELLYPRANGSIAANEDGLSRLRA